MRDEDVNETWPEIEDWVDLDELSPDVRRDLRGLSKEGAEFVGQHLVAAGTLAEDEPELAWHHARAARSKGGRIAVVRETVGLVAYRAGEWAEAIAELRAARRMGGGPGHLPVMADCERALNQPERAIELSRSAEADELDDDAALEMTIVVAGARADLGQTDAALVLLEAAGVNELGADPRLLYAYADLLLGAERREEAIDYFLKAADADVDGDTDAEERVIELTGDADDSTSDGSASEESASEESASEESASEESDSEESDSDEPDSEESDSDEPDTEEPDTEEPGQAAASTDDDEESPAQA